MKTLLYGIRFRRKNFKETFSSRIKRLRNSSQSYGKVSPCEVTEVQCEVHNLDSKLWTCGLSSLKRALNSRIVRRLLSPLLKVRWVGPLVGPLPTSQSAYPTGSPCRRFRKLSTAPLEVVNVRGAARLIKRTHGSPNTFRHHPLFVTCNLAAKIA